MSIPSINSFNNMSLQYNYMPQELIELPAEECRAYVTTQQSKICLESQEGQTCFEAKKPIKEISDELDLMFQGCEEGFSVQQGDSKPETGKFIQKLQKFWERLNY